MSILCYNTNTIETDKYCSLSKGGDFMKNNKMLKVTGIIQGVLIATLLLLAISIQVVFMYNTYYCEDYTFDFLRNMGIGYWD